MNTTRIWLLALVGVFGAGDVDACADPLQAGAAAVEITLPEAIEPGALQVPVDPDQLGFDEILFVTNAELDQ